MMELLLFVTLPVMLFVAVYAENTIIFFFGEQWRESSIYLQLLSIMSLFQIMHKVFINIVIVKGDTKTMLVFAIIKQALRVLALMLTIHISVKAMVLGFVISGIIGSILYIGLGMYYLRYNLKEFFLGNYKTFMATFLAMISVQFLGNIFSSIYAGFILQCFLMLIIYLFLNILQKNESACLILSLLKSVVKR